MKITQIFVAGAIFLNLTIAQSQLKLDEIMAGNDFIGHSPQDIHWSPNSQYVYFRWNKDNEPVAPYYVYSVKEKTYKKLSADETKMLPVDGYITNADQSVFCFQKDHQLFQVGDKTNKVIYSSFGRYQVHTILSPNKFIIQENDNLFLVDFQNAQFVQLTNFKKGDQPVNTSSEENFLTKQQEELFQIVRSEKERGEARENFNEAHSIKSLSPFYIGKKYVSFISVNKSFSHVVFGLDKYPDDAYTHIEEYVNADGYSRSVTARPKVGSEDPQHEIYVWNLVKDTCFKLSIDHLTDVKKRPEFFKEYETDFKAEYDLPKGVIFLDHGFNFSGDKYLVELKSYDSKDRWICYYDTADFSLTEIEHQHDEKWIGGPGISGWKMEPGNVGWISDQKVFFQSEVTGYSHLYTTKIDSKLKKHTTENLTEGNYEIHQAILSKDRTKFFISANKNHPGNREFYTLEIASKKLTPILTTDGNHEVYISPDEKYLAVNYSYKNKPWELYFAPLAANSTLTQITHSTSDKFNSYKWRSPEVINFKAEDGTTVYARIYEPDANKKNGAGVLFVHGAGYLQNAHNWWSSYHREFMFNNLLADLGYTVLDIDYRASEGYGSKFRTDIYRHMGGKDLSDHLDGRKLLIEKYGIDSNRVGIYGGSYGGFITLMAMLTEPGKFKCGAALRSVTDWAHYNHEYTSNILNTPEQDPIAYKRSSPIYFAEGLQDRLLLLHGMEDDNVQYQDVVRLSQRFIELKKTNWDLIGYPIEPHGFKETTSWIDEYRRILELFEEELR